MTDPSVPQNREASPSTSLSLLRQALAEDREAWERIVFLYSPLVDRWCRRHRLRDDEVQDVGQDVFLTLYRSLHQFRKDEPGQSFRKWLRTLTGSRVADHLRRKLRTPVVPAADGAPEPADVPDTDADSAEEESERIVVLRQCLEVVRAEFEPKTFDAFWHVVDGKTPAEAAAKLGMTVGAVYTARSRVGRRLRELLDDLEDDLPGV